MNKYNERLAHPIAQWGWPWMTRWMLRFYSSARELGANNADSLDPIELWLLDDLTLGRKESDMMILVYRMLRYGMKYVD